MGAFRGIEGTPMKAFSIAPVRCLQDNFGYILWETSSRKCFFVDPVEPEKVLSKAKSLLGDSYDCVGLLTTHHHSDHDGGNAELVKRLKVPVWGGDERISGLSNLVKHGDKIALGDVVVQVLSTPCHTSGHVCYFVDGAESAVFTGDTLFLGGCGRFFEGTAEQMDHALNSVLGSLPDATRVYCGHEYTVGNLMFGAHAEPDNADIAAALEAAKAARARDEDTIPGTIAQEKLTNVFMRVRSQQDPVAAMAKLREQKNNWKP